ncbi:N-6 DNA methylase [Actinocrinis puniceicyclus]|uniref:N-6 DNA methylase n=1 Tax=Actinocrinis puniceicyclus TaxID=977794 RepID=A0A8J7WT93_9ACTN|nr:N-6 DNA methylase [Actinocrinis puniceicyclus]MBS2965265.1 N-6 DNA methylase [Actinocrinis puniceicyclus]
MLDEADTPLVTSAEIARLAGVGRAAVSNWRRRYPDFPKPVGGPASSPTFALAEVEKWLADTGKGEQLRTAGVTATGTQRLDRAGQLAVRFARQALASSDDSAGTDDSVAGARFVADLGAQSGGTQSGAAQSGGVEGRGDGVEVRDDAGALRIGLSFGAHAPSLAAVRDRRALRVQRERRAVFAAMLAALLPEATAGTVVDPACGSGDLLAAAGARFGDAVQLAGQGVDVDAARRASVRLAAEAAQLSHASQLSHGSQFPQLSHLDRTMIRAGDSLTGDALRAYRGRAAAVLCEPPLDQPVWPADELATDARWVFGLPAPRDAELAWVQHCYALLRPDATAVVAVSPRTCVQPSGRAIRAAMLRAGALRAVIALPAKAAGRGAVDAGDFGGGTDAVLWVLRRPYGEPDRTVAMIDLADVDLLELPAEPAAWRAVLADPARCREVPAIELLDEDVALLASRFVERTDRDLAAAYIRAAQQLPTLLERLAAGLPRLQPGSPGQKTNQSKSQLGVASAPLPDLRATTTTLHELERAGALRIHPRAFTPRAGDVLVHAGKRPPTVATDRANSNGTGVGSGLASAARKASESRSGLGNEADERTVTNVIEIVDSRLDPYFLAAFLHADAVSIPSANTSGSLSRDDLRRCRIPRLPIAQQRRYGKAFRSLAELESVLRTATEVSGHVVRTALEGLTSGALAPPD